MPYLPRFFKGKIIQFSINSRTLDFKRSIYRYLECKTLSCEDPEIDATIYPSEEKYLRMNTSNVDSIYLELIQVFHVLYKLSMELRKIIKMPHILTLVVLIDFP